MLPRVSAAALACLIVAGPAAALELPLPPPGEDIVGQIQVIKAKYEATLPDIAGGWRDPPPAELLSRRPDRHAEPERPDRRCRAVAIDIAAPTRRRIVTERVAYDVRHPQRAVVAAPSRLTMSTVNPGANGGGETLPQVFVHCTSLFCRPTSRSRPVSPGNRRCRSCDDQTSSIARSV